LFIDKLLEYFDVFNETQVITECVSPELKDVGEPL
jgi:hypothetical protein